MTGHDAGQNVGQEISGTHHFLPLVSRKPVIMGVVNVTPDSFSDGGKFSNVDKAIAHGLQLLKEGADILDIGGESTRPGAEVVDIEEEIARVVPVIEGLRGQAKNISIDTRNARVMEAALKVGATSVNDISGLGHDPDSVSVVAQAKVPVFLMHSQGVPQDMQDNPNYNNVVEDVLDYFKGRIEWCRTHRVETDMLVCDPGVGFGKTLEHNLLLLRNIKEFHALGVPILLGTSRKSFIPKVMDEVLGIGDNGDPSDDPLTGRLGGSLSSVLWGRSQGVQMFRVHDVKETRQAFTVYDAIANS
ncbi:MAG: dihydropteroate synthase [Alphaproteobacteria bacterium]